MVRPKFRLRDQKLIQICPIAQTISANSLIDVITDDCFQTISSQKVVVVEEEKKMFAKSFVLRSFRQSRLSSPSFLVAITC